MKELQLAVSIEWPQTNPISPTYNAETILESCSNLLVEADHCVRPIHYSVREFLTSPSQREIDYIHADLILAKDFSKGGFTNPSQSESDHIRKNICFKGDQSEAEIALACLTYFMTKDILAELCRGPRKGRYDLYLRLENNWLLTYCSCYFDKHIYNMQVFTDEVIDTLDSFLSIDNKALASILQIRLSEKKAWRTANKPIASECKNNDIFHGTIFLTIFAQREMNETRRHQKSYTQRYHRWFF